MLDEEYVSEKPRFDRCQFDPKMGGRSAGTAMNNAPLGSTYFGRRPGINLWAACLRILNHAAANAGAEVEENATL